MVEIVDLKGNEVKLADVQSEVFGERPQEDVKVEVEIEESKGAPP